MDPSPSEHRELMALAAWLKSLKVTHMAMEATGVYWIPVWHILEADFTLILANAQHVLNQATILTFARDALTAQIEAITKRQGPIPHELN